MAELFESISRGQMCRVIIEKVQEGETVYVDEDIWNDLYMEDEFIDLYEEEYEDWEDEDE